MFTDAQNWIKTTSPCNNEYLKNVPGEWIHSGDPWHAKVPKQEEQEIRSRAGKIHQFIYPLVPSLYGIDAAWWISSANYDFAQQARIEHLSEGQSRTNYYNGIALVDYAYTVKFYEYSCSRTPNEMLKGYPREDGATVSISTNTLNQFLRRDYGGTEGMQIDGRNIKMMPRVTGTWKGYTMYYTEYNDFSILLHRDGILPYIPVTRKQYLELAISYFNKFYDNLAAGSEKSAKLGLQMGIKPDRDYKAAWEKQKNEVLKFYTNELTTTTNAGLLDTPAIVMGFLNPVTNYPIFIPETKGGLMLVTENPAYFRKDLPKYVPQLFIFSVDKLKWPFTPKIDPITVLEEKFPIEKLKAMIDK
jgi:hypothetical protein